VVLASGRASKEISPEVHEATTTKRTRFGATPNLMAGIEACDGKRTKKKCFKKLNYLSKTRKLSGLISP